MFEIEYKGANCITIATKQAKIVVDPKVSVAGLKDVSVKDAIELATEARFALNAADAKIILEGPGEYGIADFDIIGIAAQRHLDTENDPKISTIYRIETPEFRTAVLGNIYEKLSETQLEEIGVIDILIIPIGGGGYTLDATGAATIVRQTEPKIVIPVHYADDGIKYEVPQAGLSEFVKELNAPLEEAPKLKLKNTAALPAGLTVYQLARS